MKRPILCFSSNDWSDIASSKYHIMRYLGRDRPVLYIETMGIRNPHPSRRDLRRILEKIRLRRAGLRNVEAQVFVWSPLVIPYHGVPGVPWINRHYMARAIRKLADSLDIVDPIVWTYLPNSIDIIDELAPRTVIYHCIDDYAEFTGAPKEAFGRMERRLLRRADLTVVSSRRLLELKADEARRIRYVPHGVDAQFFADRCQTDSTPADLKTMTKPVAGFVGRIGDWIDLELLASVATSLPEWSFVLVGPANVDTSLLDILHNVHLLGRREYDQIPSYIREFDVALMPFRANKLVDSVNPLKMYEYFAVGTPVVSVPLVEIAGLGPELVTIAKRDDFAEAIERAVQLDCPEWREARLAFAKQRSWASVAETILAECESAT